MGRHVFWYAGTNTLKQPIQLQVLGVMCYKAVIKKDKQRFPSFAQYSCITVYWTVKLPVCTLPFTYKWHIHCSDQVILGRKKKKKKGSHCPQHKSI